MVRGKNTGGLHGESGDKADTLNLLDSTDSDVEWLSLPPLKGKKPKKKKNFKAQRETSCSLWGFLRVFLFISIVGTVLLLSVVSVWLTSQLNDVKEQLKQMEGRSTVSSDDLEKLFQQMAVVNRSIDQHSKTLDQVISNISTINNTVSQMLGRVVKISEGLKAAPELKQLPEKLQTVSQSLAALGSDVSGMKDTVDNVSPFMKSTNEKLDDLTKQLQDIKNQVSEDQSTSQGGNMNPELANVIQGLSQQIEDVNSTVSSQLSVLMKSNSQHQERLTQLENTTRVLANNLSSISTDHTSISSEHASLDDYSSEKFQTSVTEIVEHLLTKEGPVPTSSSVEGVMANITTDLDNLKNMDKQSQLETVSDEDYVTLDMFQTLGDGFEAKVESLNTSFVKLKTDVSTMSHLLTKQANAVSNLTYQVEATKMFIVTLQHKLEKSGSEKSETAVPEAGGTVTTASTVTTTAVKPVETNTTKEGEETQKSTELPVTTTSKPGSIHVSRIKTPEDLDINFRRWDRAGSGQVNYDSLPNFLGPEVPKEEELKPFDEDNNGLYSLEEFSKAFGIALLTTTKESSTTVTQPPR